MWTTSVDNPPWLAECQSLSQKGHAMADKTATANVEDVFAGLAIEASSEPLPEPTRGSTSGPNPFDKPLAASVEQGTPYNFYVPAAAVKRAVFLINSAARKANVGVRVVVNVQRDDKGSIVKKDGKSLPVIETTGPNKGKVLVRFQGKKERKQQTAPRPYSIVKDKSDTTGNTYIVRRRSDKQAMFKGTHDAAKAKYDELKQAALNTPAETPAPQITPTDTAGSSPAESAA